MQAFGNTIYKTVPRHINTDYHNQILVVSIDDKNNNGINRYGELVQLYCFRSNTNIPPRKLQV